MDISIAGSAASAAIKSKLSELLSFLTASNELTRRALLFVMRQTHFCVPWIASGFRMMGDDTKRVVIRIKRHIPIYPHLAPAVGEIVVADRLNDPYSSRYFYVLQRAGKRVIIRPDECVEISPAEAWPELSVSGRWARLHREQSRETARRSYYRRKQKK